jgi:hypothetical protein
VTRFEKRLATVRTKPWWLPWLSSLLLAAGALILFPWELSHGVLGMLVYFSGLLLACFAIMSLQTRIWRSRRMDVRVDGETILFGSERIPRGALGRAWLKASEARMYVRFERKRRPVEVAVDDENEGNALIRALRLDARSAAPTYWFNDGTKVRALWRFRSLLGVCALYMTALVKLPSLLGDVSIPWILPAPIVALACLRLVLGPAFARIVVGSDGLRIRRDLARERFVPYSAVDRVDVASGELVVRMRQGPDLVCSFGGPGVLRYLLSAGGDLGGGKQMAQDFVRRVDDNVAALSTAASPPTITALAKSGRTTADWIRDLTDLGKPAPTYRIATLAPEVLWRIVEDVSSPITARAAAAFVLRAALDEACATRLRATAESCAAPRLRAALELAATPTETPALLEELELLEDEPCDQSLKHFRRIDHPASSQTTDARLVDE